MNLLKKLVFIFFLIVPAAGWGAGLHYAMDIQVDTSGQKIYGTVRLSSEADTPLKLSVRNLSKLNISGRPVNTNADDTVALLVKGGREILVTYESEALASGYNRIDEENVFLMDQWYPVPDILVEYALTLTLPAEFIATSEADTVAVTGDGHTKTFSFQFGHPLDTLHIAASTHYVVTRDSYKGISIETYFFKEDAQLAETYIDYTRKYLKMYEKILTPYPYKRFAVVENIFPSGNSMPTFTLLGKEVVRLPFIVRTSLGHEILHQWFGNSVYVDTVHGNWAEGITNYLADHLYAEQESKGRAYRKRIMIDYAAYVNPGNAIPVSRFYSRRNKAESSIGYGKAAMIFHELRTRYKDETFFAALREFVRQNSFRKASWHDIQRAFEKVANDRLYARFGDWLNRKDIPRLEVEDAQIEVERGRLVLKFKLIQKGDAYSLQLPLTVRSSGGETRYQVEIIKSKKEIILPIDAPPTEVVLDEAYSIMRHLETDEIPPVMASILGSRKLMVVAAAWGRSTYKPIVDALGVETVAYITPDKMTYAMLKENSLIITGFDNPFADRLLGKQKNPDEGVRLKVYKNPFDPEKRILLVHAASREEAEAAARKIRHYGKYTELAFNGGENILKTIAAANNGISVLTRPATRAVKTDRIATLNDIMPDLMKSRVVFIGENHDRFSHHINQLQIIRKLHASGAKIGVGMEMFPVPSQGAVDDYLAGKIDEQNFLSRSGYFENWGFDYNLYKPIIDYLKEHEIPLVALNVENDISHKVAREGIENLTDKKKEQLPDALDFSGETYRKDLFKVFTRHGDQTGIKDFNKFFQAQMLWDEGMAETAQHFLEKNPGVKLVILAGNGHIRNKYGIPARLYARNREPYTTIVQDDEIKVGIADYILFTHKIKGIKSPKLGIQVQQNDRNLSIAGLVDKGPGQKAGLQKGDIITMFDGYTIQSLADLKIALFYSEIGKKFKIGLLRDGKKVEMELELFPLPISHPRF